MENLHRSIDSSQIVYQGIKLDHLFSQRKGVNTSFDLDLRITQLFNRVFAERGEVEYLPSDEVNQPGGKVTFSSTWRSVPLCFAMSFNRTVRNRTENIHDYFLQRALIA